MQADALVAVLAEHQRLAVLQQDAGIGPGRLVGQGVVGAVVEDDAVLQDLDEGRARVRARRAPAPCARCLRSMSTVRATKVAPAPSATAPG